MTIFSFVILLVAVANTYACKGLDRIEEKLPILNQPTTQVSWDKVPRCICIQHRIYMWQMIDTYVHLGPEFLCVEVAVIPLLPALIYLNDRVDE